MKLLFFSFLKELRLLQIFTVVQKMQNLKALMLMTECCVTQEQHVIKIALNKIKKIPSMILGLSVFKDSSYSVTASRLLQNHQ